jgi:methionyl-tRNA synthetase
MSKSLGNVIDPLELIEEYGAEAVRYYLAREISPFEDGDLTKDKFKESYNANLANGLGNLVSRIMKMAETHLDTPVDVSSPSYTIDYSMHIEAFDIQKAINVIWEHMKIMDTRIQETKPFSVIKTDADAGKQLIRGLVQDLYVVAQSLEPFLPVTSQKIKELIAQNKAPETPLFIRKE